AENGVPVFVADIKGDMGGFASAGERNKGLIKHCLNIGTVVPDMRSYGVEWLCPYGLAGKRASVPLSRVNVDSLASSIQASKAQSTVLDIVMHAAGEHGQTVDTPQCLGSWINYIKGRQDEFQSRYGGMM